MVTPDPGIPSDATATVLTECMHCDSMIETRTGAQGVRDALARGWESDGAGDLVCPACALSRAEEVEDYT